MMASVKQVSPK